MDLLRHMGVKISSKVGSWNAFKRSNSQHNQPIIDGTSTCDFLKAGAQIITTNSYACKRAERNS